MKKFIALAIAVVMLAALAVPAFAATDTTTVEYTVTETFTFSVTDKITITSTSTEDVVGTGKVTIDTINILADNKIVVTVNENHTLTPAGLIDNAENATAEIKLTVTEFTFEAEEAAGSFEEFGVKWVTVPQAAATYTNDQITFTAQIVAPEQGN